MALTKITYDTKVALSPQPSVADANKVTDADMNEIKSVVNDAIDQVDTNTENIENVTIYSTTEKTIGTWVDNKPIYRKCIQVSQFPDNTTLDIDVSSLSIDFLVNLYGYAKISNGTGVPINNARPDNNSNTIGAFLDSNTLKIRTGSDRTNCSGYIVIEYTKSTD